jgi:hypothetical protein
MEGSGARAGFIAVPALCLALLAITACSAPGSEVTPLAQVEAGTYAGTDSAGGLNWNISQAGQGPVTGTGTFLATGAQNAVSYTLRGTYTDDVLTLRLVGAPGDTDADSVWFSGRSVNELYTGAAFSGSLFGPTAALFGALSMYLTAPP